jgi:protein-S-isoprenylcysteine O-methyltransferase Ste14
MARPALALAAVLVFALAAFGARTAVQLRRHGDSGWRFGRAASAREVVAKVAFLLAIALLLAAPAAALVAGAADRPLGAAALTGEGTGAALALGAGLALVAGGAALTLVAQAQMGASWRIGVDADERTALVTHGLYRSMRNPIFTGMGAFTIGVALLVPNAVAIAGLVAGLVGLQMQVRGVEEPYLVATHGPAYRRWATTAGRFLPAVGRLRTPS